MIRLAAGPPATASDLRRAQYRERLLRTELDRVRGAALAWRNGLAGLLAALLGFSLVKGRSDIGQLSPAASAVVGVLLLLALVAGAGAALALLRAAHGRPQIISLGTSAHPALDEHLEALDSATALRRGIMLAMLCGVLLASAVGTTWYGPARAAAQAPPGSAVGIGRGVEVGPWAP